MTGIDGRSTTDVERRDTWLAYATTAVGITWQSSARIGQVIGPAVAGWLVARRDATWVLAVGVGVGLIGLVALLVPTRTPETSLEDA